jgi:DNA-binding NarL/FixJ family response regulator
MAEQIKPSIRVVLVEDNPHYRSTLKTFFEVADGFELLHTFGSAEACLTFLDRAVKNEPALEWQMVLMDVELPGINGIEATRRLKALLPDATVVMLTVFEEPSVILEAITAGADGYLLKKSSARELTGQLQGIAQDGAPLTAGVARTVLDLLRKFSGKKTTEEEASVGRLTLSEREQDVLRGLVAGRTYEKVAEDLGVAHNTVRSHVRAIYKKLQVHSVAEAVSRAVRERLV